MGGLPPAAAARDGARRWARRRARRGVDAATRLLGRDPVIVFTLPKTGSSAVATSLRHLRVARPVQQVHLLSDEGLARAHRSHAAGGRIGLPKLAQMEAARQAIDAPGRRPAVITMARHPLTRAVSWFFQSWHQDFPWAAGGRWEPSQVDDLVARFHERLPVALEAGDRWFDDELAPVVGHDVFAEAFPRTEGWEVRALERCDLAIVRTEDLDRTFGPVTHALLGTTVPLRRVNVAEDKVYARLHAELVSRLRLSSAEREAVVGTRHAAHFYTPDEVEARLPGD